MNRMILLFLLLLGQVQPAETIQPIPDSDVAEPCIPEVSEEFSAHVISVTDGDTILVAKDRHPVKIRLEGIDAPEKGQDHGTKATEALKKLVLGKTVTIKQTGTDKYGRVLAYVICDGVEVNQKLVEDGWAWHFTKYNCEERFAEAEKEARKSRIGLWEHDQPIAPWDWRHARQKKQVTEKSHKADTGKKTEAEPEVKAADTTSVVYITKSGKKYHSAGCSHLSKSKIEITLSDAQKKGYTPCSKCGGKTTERKEENHIEKYYAPQSDVTPSGKTIYTGPRGGRYHYSKSGKKVYEKKR